MKMTYNGRPFDAAEFARDLERKATDAGIAALEAKARGAAGPLVDPATGRRADVFFDRMPGERVAIRTSGSRAYADLIRSRLGIDAITPVTSTEDPTRPRVYLAHASEDKELVRPIARHLMDKGVDVWFDEWEIEPGDSLRQMMEQGLASMTHFVVVLTPVSITKPWVAREIDVGFVGLVGGANRMVPLRVGVEIADLPPFLTTLLCERFDPSIEADRDALVARLYGVSRKPKLGHSPSYVQESPTGLSGWSPAAVAVGRHLVIASEHAMRHDPVMTVEELTAATGLGAAESRIAILDLLDAGFLKDEGIAGHVSPDVPLFVDFDEVYMLFSPAEDARTIANRMVSADDDVVETHAMAAALGWPPRRMNSAICYLQRAGVLSTRQALASTPWRAVHLLVTDRTLRFARSQS